MRMMLLMMMMLMMMMLHIQYLDAFLLQPSHHDPSTSSTTTSRMMQLQRFQPESTPPPQRESTDDVTTTTTTLCVPVSRRHTLMTSMIFWGSSSVSLVTNAAEEGTDVLPSQIRAAFQTIRNEFEHTSNSDSSSSSSADSTGGLDRLQQYIQNEEYDAIMEFTKTYDAKVRKGMIKPTQQLLLQYVDAIHTGTSSTNQEHIKQEKKYIKERTTTIGNAITFDLIGLNRNARVGQRSNTNLQKYWHELRDDLQEFLTLETKYIEAL